MRATRFQSKLSSDKDALWDIVKLFHPDIPDTVTNVKGTKTYSVKDDKMETYLKYQWVCISFKVRGYGLIDIGINNTENHNLYGSGVTKKDMKEALKNGNVSFAAWRFCIDSIYSKNKELSDKNRDSFSYMAGRLLSLHGYKLIEVEEWYEYYYSD